MPPLDLAIRGGTIVTATETRAADIGILDGQIAEIGNVGDARADHDASGLLILPGVVDPHTHLDSVSRITGARTADDFLTGTEAAACGGVTTIIDYARQLPGTTLHEGIQDWSGRAAGKAIVDYGFHIVVTDFSEQTLAEIPDLMAAGFPSYKMFMLQVADADILKLMTASANVGGLVMAHAENNWVLDHRRAELVAQGKGAGKWYVDSRPEIGEAEATSRAIDYADLTGTSVCVVHLSCDAALQRARAAKARGSTPWIETRPCYLLLDSDLYSAPGIDPLSLTGCPPLRPAWNIEKLWEGIRDGTIDVIGSDHCNWTIEQKSVGREDYTNIPQGIPALEVQLPTLWSKAVTGGIVPANRLVQVMSEQPARLHGLYPRKGAVAIGSDADLVLLDPGRRETITEARGHSRTGYEPCEGMEVVGWPVATFSRGELIAQEGKVLGKPGRGQLLERSAPPAR